MTDDAAPADTPSRAAPWRGRKRVADPRTVFVAVRCTPAEHAAITAAAAQAGLSTGAYLRAVGLGTAGPRSVRRPSVDRAALAQLLAQIGKVGSNVNQLAHASNSGDAIDWADMASAVVDIADMRDAVMRALGRGD